MVFLLPRPQDEHKSKNDEITFLENKETVSLFCNNSGSLSHYNNKASFIRRIVIDFCN